MSKEVSDSIVREGDQGKVGAIVAAVRLAEIFSPDLIVLGLEQRTKQGVIGELVQRLTHAGHVEPDDEAPLIQSIMAREEMGSTALGNGIAMPHCRSSLTERFTGVVAIDENGVDFGALDRQPVQLVFLLLAPMDQRQCLFDILGRISSLRREKTIRTQFCGCRSKEDVTAILEELDGCRDDSQP